MCCHWKLFQINFCAFLSSTFRDRLKRHLSVASKISSVSSGNKQVKLILIIMQHISLLVHLVVKEPGGGTPLCDLNGDVRPDRVWFSGCFVLNGVTYFITFCLKQGIAAWADALNSDSMMS